MGLRARVRVFVILFRVSIVRFQIHIIYSIQMMDDLHLKLQLTAEDVRYVREKFLSAADAKIKYHLPPQMVFEGQKDQPEEDPMRSKVEQLVKEVC